MKTRTLTIGVMTTMFWLLPSAALGQTRLGTAFTYQGELKQAGLPVTDTVDFEFTLWDALTGGNQVGWMFPVDDVDVVRGLFTVQLDFGPDIFSSEARWLEITVRGSADPDFTLLSPRQELTPTPYALHAETAAAVPGGITGTGTAGYVAKFVDPGSVGDSVIYESAGNVGIGAISPVTALHVSGSLHLEGTWQDISVPIDECFQVGHFDGTTFTERVHIDLAGNVGIGTTSPGSPLTVAGEIESTAGGFKFPDASVQTSAASGTSGNLGPRTPLQIAMLRWYEANQSGASFDVGSHPVGVAFDGASIWVANLASDNVTKLRASDGALLGTYAVGTQPGGVAFDGANIWVANKASNNVTKLRAYDGTVLGTFGVGTNPSDVAFDGTYIWVVNNGSSNVMRIRAATGEVSDPYGVGNQPWSVAFDGANVWVTNHGSNNVTKLRASDGAELGTYGVGDSPEGVAFDGANIWVANTGSDNVTKLRASDGEVLGTFSVGDGPTGVAFDGANIWVADYSSGEVTKLRASDGADLGTYDVAGNPQRMAFDGANIWVASFGTDTVSKL